MAVATADRSGRPSSRTVLLKEYDARGFVFYTNYESRKGTELGGNPYASLVFPWFAMQRQVLVGGPVERVTRAETEAYFASRPRGSQLGAWASPQSQVVPDRAAIEAGLAAVIERFGDGPVPPPPHWGGFRVLPETVEFWQGRTSRLHDRLRYRRTEERGWIVERLAP
jgi:pyridoxamine 5'-phosphate oxidase